MRFRIVKLQKEEGMYNWAQRAIDSLAKGEECQLRPRGKSMTGKVDDGRLGCGDHEKTLATRRDVVALASTGRSGIREELALEQNVRSAHLVVSKSKSVRLPISFGEPSSNASTAHESLGPDIH